MIGKRGQFSDGSKKTGSVGAEVTMADCSRGGFQPPEMHNHRQWTAVYVKSLFTADVMPLAN